MRISQPPSFSSARQCTARRLFHIATPVLWGDQLWQKERTFLFVLTCMAAAAGPVTSGQGRKPRSGGAERASLEGMAPVRPHGDKQVGTLTALGDSQPVAEALRRIGELYAIEASVLGRSSSTYRRAERGKLDPSPGQCFNRPLLTPWMAATICASARTDVQESVHATPDRLEATCRTAPGSRSQPRSGGALGRAGLDPAASADRKVSTTGSTSFNGALIRSDRSVCLAQVSDGLPADRRR